MPLAGAPVPIRSAAISPPGPRPRPASRAQEAPVDRPASRMPRPIESAPLRSAGAHAPRPSPTPTMPGSRGTGAPQSRALVPVPGPDVQMLHRRAEAAWNVAHQWQNAMREAYRWLMPERYELVVSGSQNGEAGYNRPRYDHIFDPTGVLALQDGAQQIAEALHPWDVPWARLAAREDAEENQKDEISDLCEKLTRVVNSYIRRSNFHTAATSSHRDFLISGGFLEIRQDPRDPTRIVCAALPPHEWALEADRSGFVTGMFRRVHHRARELEYQFDGPASFSREVRELQVRDPEQRVEIMLAICWDPKGKRWKSSAYEVASKHECWQASYRVPPVICYRPSASPGQPWGTGPGLSALPDVKVANKVVELILRNAAFSTTGVWQADDDGVLNARTVRIIPGAIIPKAVGSAGLQPITPPGDLQMSQIVLEDLRQNIQRAFYIVRPADRDMSATEYAGRKEQMLREMRGEYGQLRSEFAEPVVLRIAEIAERRGLIPAGLVELISQVVLVGPLAQDVAGQDVDRLKQVVAEIAAVAGPEVTMATLKLPKLIPYIVEKRHANPDLFKTGPELQKLQDQVATIGAQQMNQAAGATPPGEPGPDPIVPPGAGPAGPAVPAAA